MDSHLRLLPTHWLLSPFPFRSPISSQPLGFLVQEVARENLPQSGQAIPLDRDLGMIL